jgi:hypothetical protein
MGLAAAGPAPTAEVMRVAGTHYCEATALWEALGAASVWDEQAQVLTASRGAAKVALRPYTVLADGPRGPLVLPNCPCRRGGRLFVPTRACVELLGGRLEPDGGGLAVAVDDARVLHLGMPPDFPSGRPTRARLAEDLRDPRIGLAETAEQIKQLDERRRSLDEFEKAARVAQPALLAIADSRVLRLLGRLPLVGGLVGAAQDTAGAVGEALTLVGMAQRYDEERLAPVRRGLSQARLVSESRLTSEAVAAWRAALTALDRQHGDTTRLRDVVATIDTGLGRLVQKATEFRASHPESDFATPLAGFRTISAVTALALQAQEWQEQTYQSWFRRLVDDAAR